MVSELAKAATDIAAIAAFLLPGFIFLHLHDLTNPRVVRQRIDLAWVMWSLAISLLMQTVIHALFSWAGWPNGQLDSPFYGATIGLAALAGYLAGRLAGWQTGRDLARWAGLLLPGWPWVEVLSEQRWVVVRLKDGTSLYGFPRHFTDDQRDPHRELYLTYPQVLTGTAPNQTFTPFPETDGVFVDAADILYVQFLSRK